MMTPEGSNDSASMAFQRFEGRTSHFNIQIPEHVSHDLNSTEMKTDESKSMSIKLEAEGFHPMASKVKGGGKAIPKEP
jgi:hypothetical protein